MVKSNENLFKVIDTSNLIITGYGYFIGKESNRLIIKDKGKKIAEYSMNSLDHIYITSSCSLSSSFINSACRKGIKICIWSKGYPSVLISSPYLSAFVNAKRAQFDSYKNQKGIIAIKKVINSKIENQKNVLKYFSKNSTDENIHSEFEYILNKLDFWLEKLDKVNGDNIDEVRQNILYIEAMSAKEYWGGVKRIVSGYADFKSRNYLSQDTFNVCLNFLYSLLYSVVWMAIINSGLEPFAGFLHTDRPGKASLVYDLSEPFKQRLVDKLLIGMVKKKVKLSVRLGRISNKTLNLLSSKFSDELLKKERYKGKNFTLNSIIQKNIYSFVDEIKDNGVYIPYKFKW